MAEKSKASKTAKTHVIDATSQRKALEEAERHANAKQPRNFKDDAMEDKQVRVEPDGTGPTSTGTFDADKDRAHGSGNATSGAADPAGAKARAATSPATSPAGGRGSRSKR